jgi:hypothetical protein
MIETNEPTSSAPITAIKRSCASKGSAACISDGVISISKLHQSHVHLLLLACHSTNRYRC